MNICQELVNLCCKNSFYICIVVVICCFICKSELSEAPNLLNCFRKKTFFLSHLLIDL